MKTRSVAKVEIECSNPYSIPLFEDFVSEIQRKFDIEKNAKDEAYSFIIQMGLLEQFKDFAKHYKGINHYDACLDMLSVSHRPK